MAPILGRSISEHWGKTGAKPSPWGPTAAWSPQVGSQERLILAATRCPPARGTPFFIRKALPSGEHLWSKVLPYSSGAAAWAVAIDHEGNVGIAGFLERGSIDMGGHQLTASSQEMLVARFSPIGEHLWSRSVHGSDRIQASTISVDSFGDVFVAGQFRESVDFGTGALVAAGHQDDVFLVKLSGKSGQTVWARQLGGSDDDRAESMAIGDDGSIVVAGASRRTKSDPVEPQSAEQALIVLEYGHGKAALVAKFSATGALLWKKLSSGTNEEEASRVVATTNGDFVVAGEFDRALSWGDTRLVSSGSQDVFVLRNSTGPGIPYGPGLWAQAASISLRD